MALSVSSTVGAPTSLQVGRKADRLVRLPLLDRLVALRLGKGRVTAEGHVLALCLLPVDPNNFRTRTRLAALVVVINLAIALGLVHRFALFGYLALLLGGGGRFSLDGGFKK
jgi:hypothetical protein